MLFSALITIISLLIYAVFIFNVGKARGRYGLKAPATTGNADFERYLRVQVNTLEQLMMFIPGLWIFGLVWGKIFPVGADGVAATIGGIWIIGRILYAKSYYKDASKRTMGFVLTMLPNLFLLLGSLVGVIFLLLRNYHLPIPFLHA